MARSPLDLGREPAAVRPRSQVPYVPSAALVVRRRALDDVGGFDETLRTGEDVDLVWRLDRAGWRVRYDPSVTVGHPVRSDRLGWVRQRIGYGRSAAPLARRHGPAVAPLVMARSGAVSWVLVALGHPVAALAVTAGAGARLARRRDGLALLSTAEVTGLVLRGQARAGVGLVDALRRAWWPLAVPAAVVSRRARRLLLVVAVAPPLLEWWRRRPAVGPVTWTVLRLADDLAYGAGVWAGALQARDATCLAPILT